MISPEETSSPIKPSVTCRTDGTKQRKSILISLLHALPGGAYVHECEGGQFHNEEDKETHLFHHRWRDKETKTGVKDRSRNKGVGSNILSVCKLHIVMISALTLNIYQVLNSRFQTDYWTFPACFWLNYLLSRAVSTPRHPDCNTSHHESFSLVCADFSWNFLNPLCRKCFWKWKYLSGFSISNSVNRQHWTPTSPPILNFSWI